MPKNDRRPHALHMTIGSSDSTRSQHHSWPSKITKASPCRVRASDVPARVRDAMPSRTSCIHATVREQARVFRAEGVPALAMRLAGVLVGPGARGHLARHAMWRRYRLPTVIDVIRRLDARATKVAPWFTAWQIRASRTSIIVSPRVPHGGPSEFSSALIAASSLTRHPGGSWRGTRGGRRPMPGGC